MTGAIPEVTDLTNSSAILRFKQMSVNESLANYYIYNAQYKTEETNYKDDFSFVKYHNETVEYLFIKLTGLSPNAKLIARIHPYRIISHVDFNNKTESGSPSQEVNFTTCKYLGGKVSPSLYN